MSGLVKCVACYEPGGDNINFPADGKSLDFSLTLNDEFLRDAGPDCQHFRKKFTIAVWVLCRGGSATMNIVHLESPESGNRGDVDLNIFSDGKWDCNVHVSGTDVGTFDVRTTTGTITFSQWVHLAAVVDMTVSNPDPNVNRIKLYRNGILEDREYIGGAPGAAFNRDATLIGDFQFGNGSDSEIWSWAFWDVKLGASSIKAIYNNGVETVNLLRRKGSYRKPGRLQHWIVPELNSNDMGHDYGHHTDDTARDLMNDENNITAVDDLIGSTPSGR